MSICEHKQPKGVRVMKAIPFILLFAVGMIFWAQSLNAQYGAINPDKLDKPVVIELFTSQSCSSCPPADRNLADLSKNPNVIALGFHVTYWDHLNWKDTLGQEFATQRQNEYSTANKTGRVYTPQMIVNGTEQFVGSRKDNIQKSLDNAHAVEPIEVAKAGNWLHFDLPHVGKADYKIWVAGVKDEHVQPIKYGENGGRTVTYSNAVVELIDGGAWDGSSFEKTLNIKTNKDVDHYVVFAQENGYGAIIAAGKTPARDTTS